MSVYSAISVLLIQPQRAAKGTVSTERDGPALKRLQSQSDNTLQITHGEAQTSDKLNGEEAWFGKEMRKSKF